MQFLLLLPLDNPGRVLFGVCEGKESDSVNRAHVWVETVKGTRVSAYVAICTCGKTAFQVIFIEGHRRGPHYECVNCGVIFCEGGECAKNSAT